MTCKHLRAYVDSKLKMGHTYCPDCHEMPHIADVFNELLKEVRKVLDIPEAEQPK